jgi:hypothetical protein
VNKFIYFLSKDSNEVMGLDYEDEGRMTKTFFKKVTSHLRKGNPVDQIEVDMLEEKLNIGT